MNRRNFVKNGLIGVGVAMTSSHLLAKESAEKQTDKPHIRFPSVGNKITATIVSSEVPCTIGMKPGDEFDLGFRKCGNFCGFFYSSIHKSIMGLQFSQTASPSETHVFECPNDKKRVKVELRIGEA